MFLYHTALQKGTNTFSPTVEDTAFQCYVTVHVICTLHIYFSLIYKSVVLTWSEKFMQIVAWYQASFPDQF